MSQNILTIALTRDGPFMPWGFRLQGGSDLGHPLTIQRVFLGSPSEGELYRGDIIMRIMDQDASRLTHQEAHDVIVSSGNTLKFVVQRVPGAAASFGSTPTTPSPVGTGHPLASSARTSIKSTSAEIYRDYIPTTTSTLPTVKMGSDYHPKYPEPKSLADYEREDYFYEQQREQQVIHHQPYRTVQLVFPKAKPRHDIPMGSYLRHVHDPTWDKTYSPSSRIHDSTMVAKVHESVKGMRFSSTSTSSDRTPTPDSGISGSNSGPRVVHRQYNIPLKLYSKQTVSNTMQGQTGIHPGQPNPKMATGPGIKNQVAADIVISPTYKPPQPHLNTLPETKRHGINAFGKPKDKIIQSNTFNTLMSALVVGQSDY
ncbi:PDZ and LIM domain protein 7-like [Limulus polyphemus]|uniref:PDZ and LIM domain protein 7-like n=1 Tax=Limulus polyphemus TaxID=6850 RepID=A0ABM1B1Q6_LIMPO|nr:PDZ and LIM domain protein 7-like [Limulus polyphemus]